MDLGLQLYRFFHCNVITAIKLIESNYDGEDDNLITGYSSQHTWKDQCNSLTRLAAVRAETAWVCIMFNNAGSVTFWRGQASDIYGDENCHALDIARLVPESSVQQDQNILRGKVLHCRNTFLTAKRGFLQTPQDLLSEVFLAAEVVQSVDASWEQVEATTKEFAWRISNTSYVWLEGNHDLNCLEEAIL